MASTKSSKNPYVKSGSGSSLKNILRAPVVTWMSSHLLSSRSTVSSDGRGGRQAETTRFQYNKPPDGGHVELGLAGGGDWELNSTVIHCKAKLLDHCQVPTDSVQAVNVQTCRTRGTGRWSREIQWEEMMKQTVEWSNTLHSSVAHEHTTDTTVLHQCSLLKVLWNMCKDLIK